jgi:hypothetical protein
MTCEIENTTVRFTPSHFRESTLCSGGPDLADSVYRNVKFVRFLGSPTQKSEGET